MNDPPKEPTGSSGVRWLVQTPPPGDDSPTLELIRRACERLSLPLSTIEVIRNVPPSLPPLEGPTCLHGRMTLLRTALNDPSYRRTVFFDPSRFAVETALEHWGKRMLNSEATVQSWEQLLQSPPHHSVFVRPNDDDKSFTGGIFTTAELINLYEQLRTRGWTVPTARVAIAPPRDLDGEARLFMVEGRFVGGSFYRPDASPLLPREMIAFAEEAAMHWSPAPVFVLDVARTESTYRIVEANCFNGSRFYGADVVDVVAAVSAFQKQRWAGF